MPCYHPMKGFRTGFGGITFSRNASRTGVGMNIPCGQCIGCRLERSRQWAVRCVHEAKLHPFSCFVTLTYDDEHLPAGGTLVLRDLQLFMKRLRKARPEGVRFYACGEYGDENRRPHYHALLFGVAFPDRVRIGRSGTGDALYRSEELRRLWFQGHNVIGDVTFDSAAYVARYCLKKVTGKGADRHYEVIDGDGVVYSRAPEFAVMSRNPGIGYGYYQKYGDEVRNLDSIHINGHDVKPPRYYDVLTERHSGELFVQRTKAKRKREGFKHKEDQTVDRLRVREKVTELNMTDLKRKV